MSAGSLARKLQIKSGYRILLINPPLGYADTLKPLPDGAEIVESPNGVVDLVHLFVRDQSELVRYGVGAMEAVKPNGIFWISWPKRSSGVPTDLTRDRGWNLITDAGWKGVANVSIDDVWSAVRFRRTASR